MNKKIFKILLMFGFLAGVFSACEMVDEHTNEFAGKSFVFFETETLSVDEAPVSGVTASGTPYLANRVAEVKILRSSPDVSSDLTVNFSIAANYTSDSDFFNAGDDALESLIISEDDGQIVIPAGEYSATLTITVVNDILSAGNRSLEMEITGVSDNSYEIGTPASNILRKNLSVVINDDDCPIDIPGDWAGTYAVSDVAPAGSSNDGFSLGNSGFYSGDVVLTADETDPAGITAILANAAGGNFLSDAGYNVVYNTCPQLINAENMPLGFIVNGSAATLVIRSRVSDYNPESFSFTIRGDLINAGGSTFGQWDFTFTKK